LRADTLAFEDFVFAAGLLPQSPYDASVNCRSDVFLVYGRESHCRLELLDSKPK
jgi:hypothetical protein